MAKQILVLILGSAIALACGSSDETSPDSPPPTSSDGRNSGANETTTATSETRPAPGATKPATGSFPFCTGVFDSLDTMIHQCCASDLERTPVQQLLEYGQLGKSSCEEIYGASAANGRLVASKNKAACDAAAAALATAACSDFKENIKEAFYSNSPLLAACASAYEGVQAAGAPCAVPDECKAGLACTGYVAAEDGRPGQDGTCMKPPPIGKPCGAAEVDGLTVELTPIFGEHPLCATGAYCDFGTCVAKKAAGKTCFTTKECIDGTRCNDGSCVVAGPVAEGGSCQERSDCAFPLECLNEKCAAPGAAGAPCTADKDCSGECVKASGASSGMCASICGSR